MCGVRTHLHPYAPQKGKDTSSARQNKILGRASVRADSVHSFPYMFIAVQTATDVNQSVFSYRKSINSLKSRNAAIQLLYAAFTVLIHLFRSVINPALALFQAYHPTLSSQKTCVRLCSAIGIMKCHNQTSVESLEQHGMSPMFPIQRRRPVLPGTPDTARNRHGRRHGISSRPETGPEHNQLSIGIAMQEAAVGYVAFHFLALIHIQRLYPGSIFALNIVTGVPSGVYKSSDNGSSSIVPSVTCVHSWQNTIYGFPFLHIMCHRATSSRLECEAYPSTAQKVLQAYLPPRGQLLSGVKRTTGKLLRKG